MSNPVPSENEYIGESGRPINLLSLSSYYSPSTYSNPVVIQPHSTKATYNEILNEAERFFDKNVTNYSEHNRFFERFIPEWLASLDQGRYVYAELIWESVLKEALRWEKTRSQRIHKGAPYYYWGVTCIIKEDLEKGFLLMHQALEEDKKSAAIIRFQNTPSYAFVTLDYQQRNQFFYDKIKDIAALLHNQLNVYNNNRNGLLTLAILKSKLLSSLDSTLLDIVYLFVFDLFHFRKIMKEYDQNMTDNIYGYLTMANTIASLCLVIDNLITYNAPPDIKGKRFTIVLDYLASKTSLNLKQNMIESFNKLFQNDFPNTLKSLITSKPLYGMTRIAPSSIEEDSIIVYGLRNFGAHRIENQPIFNTHFKEISNRVFNVLFFTIEHLY